MPSRDPTRGYHTERRDGRARPLKSRDERTKETSWRDTGWSNKKERMNSKLEGVRNIRRQSRPTKIRRYPNKWHVIQLGWIESRSPEFQGKLRSEVVFQHTACNCRIAFKMMAHRLCVHKCQIRIVLDSHFLAADRTRRCRIGYPITLNGRA